jgi:hypothetical protein
MPPKNGIIEGYLLTDPSMQQQQIETPSPEPSPGYPSFEEAKLDAISERMEEVSERLIRYLSVPGRELEAGPLFFSLDFQKQMQFIDSLLAEVFEGEAGHNDPPTIQYRKEISNQLRIVKNEVDLNNAVSGACVGKADEAVKFFRANPHRIGSFFAELVREHGDESKAVTEMILDHLLGKLRKPVS